MSTQFELEAEKRDAKGTSASRRLRRESKVPGIIYGGGQDPMMIAFDHDTVFHLLEHEAFHTSIIGVKCNGTTQKTILRDVHWHTHKPRVMHMDLQRISESEKIHMLVPLHFQGEETAPGVKQDGGLVAHLLTEVDVICLPKHLPEYLVADLSSLHIGDSVHLSDIKLPEGVELTVLTHGGDDLAVATITKIRGGGAEEESAAGGEAAEKPAEGE